MAPPKKRKVVPAATRTTRLLALVSYLTKHGRVSVSTLAEHFGVTEQQIHEDINLLWVTGTPGYMADDLIDFDAFAYEDGQVEITAARGLGATLKLGVKETIALVAALHALKSLEGARNTNEATIVESLIEKLTANLGQYNSALDVRLANPEHGDAVATLRASVASGTPVAFSYANAQGNVSQRTVEPWSVFTQDGSLYLTGYCQTARAERVFKLDRMGELDVLEGQTFTVSPLAASTEARVPAAGNRVELVFTREGRWLAEQIPSEQLVELNNGDVRLTVDVASGTWLTNLLTAHATLVREVSSPIVADQVRSDARAALALYAEHGINHSASKGENS